jgi:hypothetical protein
LAEDVVGDRIARARDEIRRCERLIELHHTIVAEVGDE